MIAAVIFVLAFLVLGLSVLVFAFSGRAGSRYRRAAPSRAGRRFVAVMVTIVIVFTMAASPHKDRIVAVVVIQDRHPLR